MVVRELLIALGVDIDAPSFKRADKAIANLAAQAQRQAREASRAAGEAVGIAAIDAPGVAGGGDVSQGVVAQLAGLKSVAATIADVGTKIGYALANAVAQVTELGSRLNRTAAGFRVNATELQGWEHAVGRVGVGAEEFTGVLGQLESKAFGAAFRGDAGAVMAFARLGVRIRGTNGQLKTGLELFEDAVDRLDKMKPGVEKTQKAIELLGEELGRQASQEGFSQRVRQWRKDVEDFGAALDEDARTSIRRYGEEQSKLGLILKNLRQSAALPLIDSLALVGNRITETIRKEKGSGGKALGDSVAQFGKLEEPLSKIGVWLYKALPYLGLVIEGFAAVANVLGEIVVWVGEKVVPAFEGMGTVLIPLGAAIFAAFFPLTALLVAIVGIADDLITYSQGGDSLFGTMLASFHQWEKEFLKPSANEPWWLTALRDAYKLIKEDIPAAWHELKDALSPGGHIDRFNKRTGLSKVYRGIDSGLEGAAGGLENLLGPGVISDALRFLKKDPSVGAPNFGDAPIFSTGAFVPTVAIGPYAPGRSTASGKVVHATLAPQITVNADGFEKSIERVREISTEVTGEFLQSTLRQLEQQ